VTLAHQGGWDEALFVAVPMAVFAVLLWIAKRRAEAEAAAAAADDDATR
jgi:cyanate permease